MTPDLVKAPLAVQSAFNYIHQTLKTAACRALVDHWALARASPEVSIKGKAKGKMREEPKSLQDGDVSGDLVAFPLFASTIFLLQPGVAAPCGRGLGVEPRPTLSPAHWIQFTV